MPSKLGTTGDVLGGQQQIMQVHCADANKVVQQVESRSGGSMGPWSSIIKSRVVYARCPLVFTHTVHIQTIAGSAP